jgi:predicted GIY-YIG superfamily endonuclease
MMYLYLMQKGDSNLYKIGITNRPDRRLQECQRSMGREIHLINCWTMRDARAKEKALKTHLFQYRRRLGPAGNGETEWYQMNSDAAQVLSCMLDIEESDFLRFENSLSTTVEIVTGGHLKKTRQFPAQQSKIVYS